MRWGPITLIVAVSLVVACAGSKTKTNGALRPTSLTFDEIYVADQRSIDLAEFTLNGQPLKEPEFALDRGQGTATFELVAGGPLGAAPLLVVHPHTAGELHQTLSISLGHETYNVPVTGRAKPLPDCPETVPCHRLRFSFTEEKCVDEKEVDGLRCAPPDCEGFHFCVDGACTYQAQKDVPPVCKQDVVPVTLQPAWTYEPDGDRVVFFEGLADADGNVYFLDCAPNGFGGGPCDVVSLTAEGQPRWRIPPSAFLMYEYGPHLSIVGAQLIVSIPQSGPSTKLAFRLSDGSPSWQLGGLSALVPASPGSAAAVFYNGNLALNADVVFLDLDTGAELKRLDDVILGSTTGYTVSDGQGTLYTSSHTSPTTSVESAVRLEQGLLWRIPAAQFEDVWATDGTHLFTGGNTVLGTADGQPLYADPGLKYEICFNQGQEALFTTTRDPKMIAECQDHNLRRMGLNDGVQESSCRLRENDVPLNILTPLIPTRDGGTAFLVATKLLGVSADEKPSLRLSDADGTATYVARLDGQVFPKATWAVDPVAVAKGHWVMSGLRPSGRIAIVAYEVPGLALAEHGWLYPHGSQARSDAPW